MHEPLLVEDVVLLLFQPESGPFAGENILQYVLGGAVLGDLALAQRVEVRNRRLYGEVHAVGDGPMPDPLLDPAWSFVSQKPRDVQTVVATSSLAARSSSAATGAPPPRPRPYHARWPRSSRTLS